MSTKTIDLTPTWEQILPTLVTLLELGDAKGREAAMIEFERMAKLADAYVASQKESK